MFIVQRFRLRFTKSCSFSPALRVAALAVILLSAISCRPAPDVQFASAESFMADADYRSAIVEVSNVLRERPDDIAARMLLGNASFQIADFTTAEAAYRRVLTLGHDTPTAWSGLGRSMLMQGNVRAAFEQVVPNLAGKSDEEDHLILIGDILFALGNTTDALVEYRKAVEQNSVSPGGLAGMAMIAAASGDHPGAQKYVDAATDGNPGSPVAWRAKADLLRSVADFDQAVLAYDRAISTENAETPLADRFIVRMNRLSALIESNRFEDAQADFEDLRRLIPGHPVLGFFKGRIAFGLGDFEFAQNELQKYLAIVPHDLRGTAALGAVNFSQANLHQAEFYLGQAVRANVGGEMTRRLLAETQLRLNKPEEALKGLREAELAGQSDAVLLAMLGRAEMGVGDSEAAINYFEQGMSANPENAMIRFALATSYLQAGRPDDAIELLESMQGIDNTDFRREMILMSAHISNGATDKAVAEESKLLRDNPNNAKAFSVAGAMRLSLGDLEFAREHFYSALTIEPENLMALYSLGNMAFADRDLADARRNYERLLDTQPAFVPGLVMLASVLQQEGGLDEMRSRVVDAMSAEPNSVAVHLLATRLALARDNTDEAKEILGRIRESAPDDMSLSHLEGLVLMQEGQTRLGLRNLDRAAVHEPGNATYQFDLAQARIDSGDFAGALTAISEFRKLQPNDVAGLAILVTAEIRLGQPLRVRPDVVSFLVMDPDNLVANELLGDVDLELGDAVGALSSFESVAKSKWTREIAMKLARAHGLAGTGNGARPLRRWLEDHPGDSSLRLFLAQILEAKGDTDAAVAEYEVLIRQGNVSAVTLNNLAWQYYLLGRSGAVELAERAHELEPDNGSITDTLAWIIFRGGNAERAVPLLREAIDQSPENPEIRFHLASALAGVGETEEAAVILRALLESDQVFPSRVEAQRLVSTL